LWFVLPACVHAAQPTKGKHIVFLAGTKSHGPGDHEYEQACRLLARTLRAHDTSLKTTVIPYGWPDDPKLLDTADTIVVYADGSDHNRGAYGCASEADATWLRVRHAALCDVCSAWC